MKNIFSKIIVIFFAFFLLHINVVHATTGTIDNVLHFAKVCHDATCASPTPGVLNFKPTGVTPLVIDDVTGISGMIWGNELGWVKMNPTGQGVTLANPTTGVLTGKAWSQVSGWINFAATGQQVKIDPSNGQFVGYAWTGGPFGGWVKFDCSDNSTCVKTSWTFNSPPPPPPPGNGGGSSSGGTYRDVCPNLNGIQASIPQGYTISTTNGLCITIVDVCPNIAGDQSTIPVGFVTNTIGACIPNIDYCPNIKGTQTTVPPPYVLTYQGDCLIPKKDACPNKPGIQNTTAECSAHDVCTNVVGTQASIPKGYVQTDDMCYPADLDLCRNIAGNQTNIPEGDIMNEKGDCVTAPVDLCPNLGGFQDHVPFGFYQKDGICLFNRAEDVSPLSKIPTIGFPFIPERFRIPENNPFIQFITHSMGIKGEYNVDLISIAISFLGLLILITLFFIWLVKKIL